MAKENLNFDNIDMIVLAMKPKDAETAFTINPKFTSTKQVVLSVLAGVTTSFIEKFSPSEQQVIRVMPNTSSMIGESATAISSGKHTSKQNISLSKELLECIGEVYVIPEEKMDIFTGIAGSGPAYFYYLMEHMEKEGIKGGLTEETTRQIIAQTIIGAAKMITGTRRNTNGSKRESHITEWNDSCRTSGTRNAWWRNSYFRGD